MLVWYAHIAASHHSTDLHWNFETKINVSAVNRCRKVRRFGNGHADCGNVAAVLSVAVLCPSIEALQQSDQHNTHQRGLSQTNGGPSILKEVMEVTSVGSETLCKEGEAQGHDGSRDPHPSTVHRAC